VGKKVMCQYRDTPISKKLSQSLIKGLTAMRRNNQILLVVAIAATVGVGSLVVIRQRDQISQQQRALDQQTIQAKALQDRSDEADRLGKQEAIFTLQLNALNELQASQVNSSERALERQRLIGQLQDLKTQRAQLVHQASCNQTQVGIQAAERSGDTTQAKSLQDRWNANCAS
jgi:hypothetical protein